MQKQIGEVSGVGQYARKSGGGILMYRRLTAVALATVAVAAWAGERVIGSPSLVAEMTVPDPSAPYAGHPPVPGFLGEHWAEGYAFPPGHPPIEDLPLGIFGEDVPARPFPKRYSI